MFDTITNSATMADLWMLAQGLAIFAGALLVYAYITGEW
jgi:hypothetical protein